MMTTNRRTFLKFLSVSPAIFHASTGFGKIFHEPPKELLSDSELLQAIPEPPPQFPTGMVIITYPGKPTHTPVVRQSITKKPTRQSTPLLKVVH